MYPTYVRRSRQAVALGAGLLLATVLSAAPAGAQAPSGFSSQPDRGSVEIVPLSADLRITRTIVDADGQQRVEHETNHLYRDSQGRTRTEDGSSVTISDPAAGTTIVLETGARTFQRTTRDGSSLESSAAPRPEGTATPNQQLSSTPRPLGEAVIGGVRVVGKEYTVTTPARENLPGREREVTLWTSTDVQLPVQTRVVEDSGEVYEQTYTNIRAGSEPAAALFQVPAGYREADPAAAARPNQTNRSTQSVCPIDYLDPVILFAFAGWWMYSPVPAVTDINQGCVFVADAAIWQWPLELSPALPLLLPVDQWDAWYRGASLPWAWLPYTAFGDVAFAAASTGDATVVDSLVILEIF